MSAAFSVVVCTAGVALAVAGGVIVPRLAGADATGSATTHLEFKLSSTAAGQIGELRLPVRETLLRNLSVNVNGEQPVELAVFAATIRDGRVASVWWSARFRASVGVNRIPSEQFDPGDHFVPGDHFISADQFTPVDAAEFGSRAYGIVAPRRDAVPEPVLAVAGSGTVGPVRVD